MARPSGNGIALKFALMPTIILIVAVLYVARDVLIPLAVAILFAFLLTPAVTWFEHRRLGRFLSIILAVGAGLAILGTITWVIEYEFVEVAAHLPDYSHNIQNKIRRFQSASDGNIGKAAQGVETTFKSMATTSPSVSAPEAAAHPEEPAAVPENDEPWSLTKTLAQYSGQVISPLASMGLILVFVLFMLVNRRDLRDRILRLVGDARLHVTTQALDDAANRITRYLLMQSAINVAYGICVGIGLWIIGTISAEGRFPNVLLWALLAMLLRFLPYLGCWIAAAIPIILSLAVFSSAGVFLATVCLYVGLELITSNLLEPWLYASSTGLSAVAVLAAAVFWTWLWGPVGLLLATPLTVCLVVLGKYVPQFQFLAVMLGDEEALEPSVRTYQRLLSYDQEEAADLLHKHLKENGLESVYQEVMIPALVLAAKDRYVGNLDDGREEFICQAMRELVEELGAAWKKQASSAAVTTDSAVTVLCLPAHYETDEIVALMLSQLLEAKGLRAIAVSKVALAAEMLDLIQAQNAPVVCISALPPAALSHSRYLCKRLRLRFPDLPTVVALWSSKADPKASVDRLSADANVRVATTLTEVLAEIHEMVQPLLLNPQER